MVQKISGSISGVGFPFTGNIFGTFAPGSARRKCPTKRCAVVLVDITEGEVCKGNRVNLTLDGKEFNDIVSLIEVNRRERQRAWKGQKVGICLYETPPLA